MMEQVTTLVSTDEIVLAEHAAVIRALGKRVVGDIVEIGRRLTDCKRHVGHGNWLPWLEREFRWTEMTATRFVNVYEMSKSNKLLDLSLPISGLYALAAPTTPDEVRTDVIDRVANGETISVKQVKAMIEEATKKQKVENEAKIEKVRADEIARYEARVERLQKESETRERKLRAELDGMLSIEDVEARVEKLIAPLKAKLEKAQERLERNKQQQEPPKRLSKKGVECAGLDYALEHLSEACLKITPEQVIEHQEFVTEATGQSMKAGLSAKLANAKRVMAWLYRFIEQAKEA